MRREILAVLFFLILLFLSFDQKKELKPDYMNPHGHIENVYLLSFTLFKSVVEINNLFSAEKIIRTIENGSLINLKKHYLTKFIEHSDLKINHRNMKTLKPKENIILYYVINYELIPGHIKIGDKQFKEEKFSDTLINVELKISYVGKYDLERQELPITINNETRLIKIPLSEAKEFKDNWEDAKVIAQKILKKDKTGYEIINIRIINPVTGSVYYFGEQKDLSKIFTSDRKISERKEIFIPELKLDVSFKDTDGNNFLDAGENGKIIIKVKNDGQADAKDLKIKIENQSEIRDLFYYSTLNCGTIKSKTEQIFELNIKAPNILSNSTVTFLISGIEANGFNPEPVRLVFNTRTLLLPKFELIEHTITNNRGYNIIPIEEVSDINLRIQNTGQGKGKNVRIRIQLPQNVVFTTLSRQSYEFREIPPGNFADISFSIIPNKDVSEEIEIKIDITDENTSVVLPFKLSVDKSVELTQEQEVINEEKNLEPQEFSNDLYMDIPLTDRKNKIAVALLIGISDYKDSRIPKVKYANRDVSLMRQYLEKTLGYEPKNIFPQNPNELFTLATMKNYLKLRIPSYLSSDGSSEVFIYFVGYGAPSPKEADKYYLLPYDVDLDFLSDINSYNLKEFYEDIRNLNASKKIIVIDASFNGQAGDGTFLINNLSQINVNIENAVMIDNTSILLLSSELSQVANWYPEKQHSMFTYFFLKGLKGEADINGNGVITIGELKNFINDENKGLPYHSNKIFQRKQRAVIVGDERTPIVVR